MDRLPNQVVDGHEACDVVSDSACTMLRLVRRRIFSCDPAIRRELRSAMGCVAVFPTVFAQRVGLLPSEWISADQDMRGYPDQVCGFVLVKFFFLPFYPVVSV